MTNDEKKFVKLNINDFNTDKINNSISSSLSDVNDIKSIDNPANIGVTTISSDNQNVKDEDISSFDSSNKDKTDSNCLSLTIVDDCNHLIKRNTFIKAIRMFFKVTVSTAILNFIKLLF